MAQSDAGQRYAVYHARDIWAMLSPREDRWLHHQTLHFRYVADVETDQLEQVFSLTNHQEESWTSHAHIVWHATDAPVRSTSVGDVIVSPQTGQAWLVLPAGFSEIISSEAYSKKARCVKSTPGHLSYS